MLVAWETPLARSTKDIDLLGRMNNTIEDVVDAIKAACSLEVIPDGLLFDVKSVVGQRIAEEADYEGVRVRFRGNLGNARITMQVDVGSGTIGTAGCRPSRPFGFTTKSTPNNPLQDRAGSV